MQPATWHSVELHFGVLCGVIRMSNKSIILSALIFIYK